MENIPRRTHATVSSASNKRLADVVAGKIINENLRKIRSTKVGEIIELPIPEGFEELTDEQILTALISQSKFSTHEVDELKNGFAYIHNVIDDKKHLRSKQSSSVSEQDCFDD